MTTKQERFQRLMSRLEHLQAAVYRAPSFAVLSLDPADWQRFSDLLSFFRAYYGDPSVWTVVPCLLGPYDGRNWFGLLTLIRSDVFYGDDVPALTILIHEAQHDRRQFGADRAHNRPGYAWDKLIGSVLASCVFAEAHYAG